MDVDRQIQLLTANAVDVISEPELRTKIGRGEPLRVKLGIDPTASDVHLGFAVVLRRLRMFQDCGHKAVLIIGDFTAMLGDPSGRSATRPQLTKEQVDAFAESYVEQIGAILDMAPDKIEIRRNSEWLAALDMHDVLRLTSQVTVARMLERDDFANRYESGIAISLMEFLYPLLQGTDSVEVRADVELGGTDQLFNLIMGRHLQQRAGQEAQVVLTTPLLVGLDGEQKMSKSLGNYVGVNEPPAEQFGKIMSIPDPLLPMYIAHATAWSPEKIDEVKAELASGALHPNSAKRLVARTVADLFHGPGAGDAAEAEFDRKFKDRAAPDDMPEFELASGTRWADALVATGLDPSKREARRSIDNGAVKSDGAVVTDDGVVPDGAHVVQNGKRKWARVVVG
ncbi:MAG TPA: tyrosine--tRNA ligase [Acidimicrobiia bacterium]|nr:tyrosine--tRNA ligase [Acidimicrobiia bacterium]